MASKTGFEGARMIEAETVTFGGSGLDRGAEARVDPAALEKLWAGARVLALWQGRVLMEGEAALGWLPPGHKVLRTGAVPGPASGPEAALFLGRDAAGTGYFGKRGESPASAADYGCADHQTFLKLSNSLMI